MMTLWAVELGSTLAMLLKGSRVLVRLGRAKAASSIKSLQTLDIYPGTAYIIDIGGQVL